MVDHAKRLVSSTVRNVRFEISIWRGVSSLAASTPVAYPGILFGGVQQIQLRTGQRERGSGSGSPLVNGSGGNCNLLQEISFHIVKFS